MPDFKRLEKDFCTFLECAYMSPPSPESAERLLLQAAWMGGALSACELAVSGDLGSAIVELVRCDLGPTSKQRLLKDAVDYDA